MSSLVLCKGHLRKFGSDEGGKVCCGFLCRVYFVCVLLPLCRQQVLLAQIFGKSPQIPLFS